MAKNTSKTNETDTLPPPASGTPDDIALAVQSAADRQAKAEQAEYERLINADQEFTKAAVATGFNVLARLARDVGASVDKFGYPALSPWRRFTNACASRAMDHNTFNRLCGLIRQAVGTDPDRKMSDEEIKTGREKCVTDKGKGAHGKSSMTLKLKAPKAWDIALGE